MSIFSRSGLRKVVVVATTWALALGWSGLAGGVASPASAAPAVEQAATVYTALPLDFTPADQPEHAPLELGVRATTDVDGWITTARYYKDVRSTTGHTAQVWSANGTLLATKAFTDESASGWQELTFDSPIAVTANTEFTVSVFSTDYWYGGGSFPDKNPGPINIVGGYYKYSDTSIFPPDDAGYNYSVDFGFTQQDYRSAGPANEPGAMKLTYKVDAGNSIVLPFVGDVQNINISWGDATADTGPINNGGQYWHQYANAGTYQVTISGDKLSQFGDGSSQSYLVSVDNFGTLGTTSYYRAFFYAPNLVAVPSTLPPGVTDLTEMFSGYTNFNQDISGWDTSAVTSMHEMFWGAQKFNAPLDAWDTSSVTDMSGMFSSTLKFNKPLNSWDTSSVTDMHSMFAWSSDFNQPVGNWDTGNVVDFGEMFSDNGVFNQDISNWDTHSATNMRRMMSRVFNNGSATNDEAHPMRTNGNKWNVSKVTSFIGMFSGRPFNQDISNWDVSSGLYFDEMFNEATNFDQNLSNWNTSSALSMTYMFHNSAFSNKGHAMTANASKWNVSKVEHFDWMFARTKINQDFSSWDFAAATSMVGMFFAASAFDNGGQPLTMNTSKVASMYAMFRDASSLNQVLNIDTSSLTNANGMFMSASSFNQDVSGWNTSKLVTARDMFNSATSFNNGGQALDWNTASLQDIGYMFYGATNFDSDIASWNTSNLVSTEATFALATNFSKDISTWDVRKLNVAVWMFYKNEKFNHSLNAWDTANLQYTSFMFRDSKFNGAIGDWDTSKLALTSGMFMGDKAFNRSLANWDVSNVSDFEGMFQDADAFNQSLATWDMTSARNIASMFRDSNFNSSVANWNLDKATNLAAVFANSAFNQPLTGWKTPSMNSAVAMFSGATAFNQDLSGLDIHNMTDALWIFDNSGLSPANYSKLLNAWSEAPHKNNVRFSAWGVKYTLDGKTARDLLIAPVAEGGSHWDLVDGGLLVVQTPTITTPPVAGDLTFGQDLTYSNLTGGVASVPGTFAYKSPSTVPGGGVHSETVVFTPTDDVNYASVEFSVNVTVAKADRSLIDNLLGVVPWLFNSLFDASAHASAGTGKITYSVTGDNCSIDDAGKITALKVGACDYSAVLAADDNYVSTSLSGSVTSVATAPSKPQNVESTITDDTITVTWDEPASNGGTAITGYTVTVTDGTNTYTCEAAADQLTCDVPAVAMGGTYSIVVVAHSSAGSMTSDGSTEVTLDTAPANTDDGSDGTVDDGSGDGTVDNTDETPTPEPTDTGSTDNSGGGDKTATGSEGSSDNGALLGTLGWVAGGAAAVGAAILLLRRRKK